MNVITVSQLNEYIKRKLDADHMLRGVAVSGEISNYVAHSSGHSYFSLKDKISVLKAVMFKGHKADLAFEPKNGMRVIAIGEVSAYPSDGVYQLYVLKLMPDGAGELFVALEELKKKLSAEGLFDESLKKSLPAYPERIGVITSETGAVRHDIENVLSRRYPIAEITLYPARVQGEGAAETVIDALFKMNEDEACDVAIIARGGGSLEELWEFNSEKLVRAIRASNIPVISAVGHETDYTLCDLAADLRAPTPSAAAELCAPSLNDMRMRLDGLSSLLERDIRRRMESAGERLAYQRERLSRSVEGAIMSFRLELSEKKSRLDTGARSVLTSKKIALIECAKKIELTDPSAILSRGYGIVLKDGKAVSRSDALQKNDSVTIMLSDGTAKAVITEVKHDI